MGKGILFFLITSSLIIAGSNRLLGQSVDGSIDESIGASVNSGLSSSAQAPIGAGANTSGRRATGSGARRSSGRIQAVRTDWTRQALNRRMATNAIAIRTRLFLHSHIPQSRGMASLGAHAFTLSGLNEGSMVQPSANSSSMTHQSGLQSPVSAASSEGLRYTDDFPDSTRGTAVISPPDTGTQSPLEWKPEINFGIPEFGQSDLLKPSLHVAGKHHRRRSRSRMRNGEQGNGKSTPTSPFPSLIGTGSQPLVDSPLGTPGQPSGQSLLSPALSPQ